MKSIRFFVLSFFAIMALWSACTKPTELGSDLFDDSKKSIGYTETLPVVMNTVSGDSLILYNGGISQTYFLCGNLKDPIFGTTTAEVGAQFKALGNVADFSQAILDSVVLTMAYDTVTVYGNRQSTVGFDVFKLNEVLPSGTGQYYSSNRPFKTETTPIGSLKNIVPRPLPTDSVTITSKGIVKKVGAHLRIKLNNLFGKELMKIDSLTFKDLSSADRDSALFKIMKGVVVRPNKSSDLMVGFNMASALTKIIVYYKIGESSREYNFEIGTASVITGNYKANYTGAPVKDYIDNVKKTDIGFAQGLMGPNVQITLPKLDSLKNVGIIGAVLEVGVAKLPNDNLDIFKPARALNVLYRGISTGQLAPVEDASQRYFDGILQTEDNIQKYKINLTGHIQNILLGKADNIIYLVTLPKSNSIQRSVLLGGNDKTFRARLKIIYTKKP
jgi:Domain of unknown function (DUF4270)